MDIRQTEIEGVFIVENFKFNDERGSFTKVFSTEFQDKTNIEFSIKEIYYSISRKNVIRGMHFQIPPLEHSKFIFITAGAILDVVLDLRIDSPTYKEFLTVEMSAHEKSIYIPKGCAHGFKALEDQTVVIYCQNSPHSKDHDTGILYNSFGFDWGLENPVISTRDQELPRLADFESPFKIQE